MPLISHPVWGFSRAVVYSQDRVYVLAHVPELESMAMDVTQVLR